MNNSDLACNLFQQIKSTLGLNIHKLVANRIYISKILANWFNHRIFNIRCLRSSIIPKSLMIKPPDSSIRSFKSAQAASRNFLRQSIHNCCVKLDHYRFRLKNLDDCISTLVTPVWLSTLQDFFIVREEHYYNVTKQRHIRKFHQLYSNTRHRHFCEQHNNIPYAVCNLSDKQLTDHELSLLQKGLNFNLNRKPLSPFEVIPAVEPALKCLAEKDANEARHRIVNTLLKQKQRGTNISRMEQKALNDLKKDKSIHITKADKGNVTVVMNKIDYEQKSAGAFK